MNLHLDHKLALVTASTGGGWETAGDGSRRHDGAGRHPSCRAATKGPGALAGRLRPGVLDGMRTLPQRTRVYRCHHLDSTRWDDVVPRPDDIVITTSLKAGTTWTQRIVSLLVFQTVELPKTLHWVSPWPDSRFIIPRREMREVVESLRHRRFLKSHLALDGLPYRESTKYIYVGRDTRDVFMSTWNHIRAYTPFARELLNS